MKLPDKDIVEGIIKRDRAILKEVYRSFAPKISAMIVKNHGSEEEAKDIFQDAMVVIYEKIHREEMPGNTGFGPYFYGICRNLWLMKLRRKRTWQKKTLKLDRPAEEGLQEKISNDLLRHQQYELYRKHFRTLGANCQKILRLFFREMSLRNIAAEMNFSEAYAKKRKHLCQKKLIEAIEQDPEYKDLTI